MDVSKVGLINFPCDPLSYCKSLYFDWYINQRLSPLSRYAPSCSAQWSGLFLNLGYDCTHHGQFDNLYSFLAANSFLLVKDLCPSSGCEEGLEVKGTLRNPTNESGKNICKSNVELWWFGLETFANNWYGVNTPLKWWGILWYFVAHYFRPLSFQRMQHLSCIHG